MTDTYVSANGHSDRAVRPRTPEALAVLAGTIMAMFSIGAFVALLAGLLNWEQVVRAMRAGAPESLGAILVRPWTVPLSLGLHGGVVLILVAAVVVKRLPGGWRRFGLRGAPTAAFGIALAGAFAVLGLTTLLELLLPADAAREAWESMAAMLRRPESVMLQALLAFAVAGLVPFAEECAFRGVLFRWMRGRMGLWRAAFLSSLLFALVHGYFLQPGGLAGLLFTVEIALFAPGLCWLLERYGSLWPCTLAHGLNNGVALLLIWSLPAPPF